MSESKTEPTSGDWTLYVERDVAAFQTHDHPSRFWVSYINALPNSGLVARAAGASPEEATANARLIASAPNLLETLKQILDGFEVHGAFSLNAANTEGPEQLAPFMRLLLDAKGLVRKADGQ